MDRLRQPRRRLQGQFPRLRRRSPTATYTSEYGATLPARVYRVARDQERYSVTVVDYRPIEKLLTEKAKTCPPFADERCTGIGAGFAVGYGYWKTDVRGALVWASWQFMQRDAKVTHYMWNFIDLVEGHQLQLTNNADKSRTFVAIYMHENRLYILEGTVPDGDPEPGLFQQSLGFVDKDGNGVRYRDYYDNDYPAPPTTGRPVRARVQRVPGLLRKVVRNDAASVSSRRAAGRGVCRRARATQWRHIIRTATTSTPSPTSRAW